MSTATAVWIANGAQDAPFEIAEVSASLEQPGTAVAGGVRFTLLRSGDYLIGQSDNLDAPPLAVCLPWPLYSAAVTSPALILVADAGDGQPGGPGGPKLLSLGEFRRRLAAWPIPPGMPTLITQNNAALVSFAADLARDWAQPKSGAGGRGRSKNRAPHSPGADDGGEASEVESDAEAGGDGAAGEDPDTIPDDEELLSDEDDLDEEGSGSDMEDIADEDAEEDEEADEDLSDDGTAVPSTPQPQPRARRGGR